MKRILTILFLLLISKSPVWSAYPYPVKAEHGMVVTAEPIASQIGLEVLKSGGNAIDAAVAIAMALNVTEGYSSGLGGGCFILIYQADKNEVIAIDGRERAPISAHRNLFINPQDSSLIPGLSTEGATAVATPGELAALELIHKSWGKLKWRSLIKPAIAVADTGFALSRTYTDKLIYFRERLYQYQSTREIFFMPGDTLPYSEGDRLVQKDLARLLGKIADKGAGWFYKGRFADDLTGWVQQNGGWLTKEDLASYQSVKREPIHGQWRGYDIYSMPPPSSGGIHVVQILKMLEPFNIGYWGKGSSETIHLLAESMKRAFADRAFWLGDPDLVEVPVAGLLDSSYIADWRTTFRQYEAHPVQGPGHPSGVEGTQTTHFSVIDVHGNMAAVTASINTSFGSGVVLPGWGLLLNNHMDDFSAQPGVPNYYGLIGSEANAIAPGKRPLSSMSPTLVLRDGRPVGVLGSPGGPRIITTVVQVLLNIIEFGMDVQAAVDFPRVHHQWKPDVLFLEDGIPNDVSANLKTKGHRVVPGGIWSAAQCIWIDEQTGHITGGTDHRIEGAAVGY